MPVGVLDFVEAIAHLPSGAVLRIDNVSWDSYHQLLSDLGDGYAVRIFYDQGRMEIMAPLYAHEKAKEVVHTLVLSIRDELDIEIESAGSTTLRLKLKAKGAEPDDSFYVQNAPLMIGKQDDLNLEKDPPPDLAIEVERTSASLSKFPIYATIGIPELWRITDKGVRIYLLSEGSYNESTASHTFPFLSARTLSDFLVLGLSKGERSVSRDFRKWLRSNRP